MSEFAISGSVVKFQVGDGGTGTGVQASKVAGTGDSKLKILNKVAGTAGNSKTFEVIVSGNNTAYSQTVTQNSVSITSATDGSGLATTTVAQAIASLYADQTFVDYFQANTDDGDGSGVLVASASSDLSGGSAGGEVFTTLAGCKDLSGPSREKQEIDVTSMSSPGNSREYISGKIDNGEMTFTLNFLPDNAQHLQLNDDFNNSTQNKNFRVLFNNTAGSYMLLSGYVKTFSITAQTDSAVEANLTIRLSGLVSLAQGITG